MSPCCQALHSLLLSWYMAGYQAGLYQQGSQGRKEKKEKKEKKAKN